MRARRLSRRRRTRKTRSRQRGGAPPLNIRYGSVKVQGQRLQSEITQRKPSYTVPKGHTLIMYDPDAPAGTWLHWLVTSEGDLWPYQPPSPPSGTHRYQFRLVEGSPVESEIRQSGIDPSKILPGHVKGESMFLQSA